MPAWIWILIVLASGALAWALLGPTGLVLWLIPGIPPPGPLG